jgi:5-formyltetrahydrofolate cyclo-ligase
MDEAPTREDILRHKVRAELRKRMRALRNTTPASACAVRSALILERLATIPPLVAAKKVALFWPIEEKNEVDLRPLDASLRARGAKVAYPTIDPDTGKMTFRDTPDTSLLEERGFGFREPPYGAPEATDVDVIVVPSLALDTRGHRLGYGAGYYDRTLPAYPRAVTIGVGFEYGMLVEVPDIETDVAVQWIVTDKRTIEIAAEPR